MFLLCRHQVRLPAFLPELSRKSLQEALWNDEVYAELIETDVDYKFYKPEDREACILEIDKVQRQSLNSHKCYLGCKGRGKLQIS